MNFTVSSTRIVFIIFTLLLLLPAQSLWAQQSTEVEIKSGKVLYVDENDLVVLERSGVNHYTVPADFRFNIKGKKVPVHELEIGTTLIAVITTVTKPETVTTTEVKRGKVWRVVGNTLIVTMENGQNEQFVVPGWFKFNVNGQEKVVSELRPGMMLTANIVHEEQINVSTTTRRVMGTPAPQRTTPRSAPRPAPISQPRVSSNPATMAASTPPPRAAAPEPVPATLPATGSSVPLMGLLGVLVLFAALGLRMVRVFLS